MGRLLDLARTEAQSRLRHAWQAWDQFWFQPTAPHALAWLRVLSGVMLLYTHVVWGLALDEFFGPDGWQDPLLVQTHHADGSAWSFWWLVPDAWRGTVHGICLALMAAYTLGLYTRLTSLLSLIITISYAHRAPLACFGLDQINVLMCLYLCLAPSGDALSLDRWRRRVRESWTALRREEPILYSTPAPSAATGLAIRLLQLHMALLYLFAGLSKLKGDTWWDGSAIWLAAGNYEYQSLSLVWLCWHPWLVNVLTHATVLWESTFIFFIWKPRLRPLLLAVGTGMHLGIGLFLGMWTFGLVMIFTYVSYIPPQWIEAQQRRLLAWRRGEPQTCEYVASSFWQTAWLALRCASDLRGRLQPVAVPAPVPPPVVQPAPVLPIPPWPQLAPGEWWRQLQRQAPVWTFPDCDDGRHFPPRLLIVRSHLRPLMELQDYFSQRGFEPRIATDFTAAAALLSTRPFDAVVLLVEKADDLPEAESLRALCESGGRHAPVTVVAATQRIAEEIGRRPTSEHRVMVYPFSKRELREELCAALIFRGIVPETPIDVAAVAVG